MEKDIYNFVAFDCGNSSIKVVLATVEKEKIKYQLIHEVENCETEFLGKYHWNIMYIFKELKLALKKAYEKCGYIDSVGISTWGIDYGLLSGDEILSSPLCYRNKFGQSTLRKIKPDERKNLFYLSGIQCDKINTLYQLVGYREKYPNIFKLADNILLIPDLLVYLFTGQIGTEASITSTTQYYDFNKKDYSNEILSRFNISKNKLPKLIKNGKVRGYIKDDISKKLLINKFPFICVASHDTASAVVSIPSSEENFIFISSGTWSLIGTETLEPIINFDSYNKGFSNETGVFDTINFLKNTPGLFIAQRLKKDIENEGVRLNWDEICEAASLAREFILIDINDEKFFNPLNMKEAINEEALKRLGKKLDNDSLFRSVYESLGESYKKTINEIEKITNKYYKNIYIVGGGSKNKFLNQITANKTGKTVIAGPEDATSLGNIAVQFSHFINKFDLSYIRNIIKNSVDIEIYEPDFKIESRW